MIKKTKKIIWLLILSNVVVQASIAEVQVKEIDPIDVNINIEIDVADSENINEEKECISQDGEIKQTRKLRSNNDNKASISSAGLYEILMPYLKEKEKWPIQYEDLIAWAKDKKELEESVEVCIKHLKIISWDISKDGNLKIKYTWSWGDKEWPGEMEFRK